MAETPEQKARRDIDVKLIVSGWLVQDRDDLDLFWIKGQSLTDTVTDILPPPDVIATEIVDELEAAFDLFSEIAKKLPKSVN